MIKFIDKIEYLNPKDSLEELFFNNQNEHYKKEVNGIFEKIKLIKTDKNAIVIAYGNLENGEIKFKLECEDLDLSKKIQFLFNS